MIYKHLANIYKNAKKEKLEEDTRKLIVKKFGSENVEVWLDFGSFYYVHKKVDEARKLMQRALLSLPDAKRLILSLNYHLVIDLNCLADLEMITKFAQMEFNFGDKDRGKILFENLINNYPKRTDIWSIFLDSLIKYELYDEARYIVVLQGNLLNFIFCHLKFQKEISICHKLKNSAQENEIFI